MGRFFACIGKKVPQEEIIRDASIGVFGAPNSGKSSLVKVMMNREFHSTGSKITEYHSPSPVISEPIIISEISGDDLQNKDEAVSKCRLAIICFTKDSFDSLKFIRTDVLPALQLLNPNCTKVLVMTRMDLVDDEFIQSSMDEMKELMIKPEQIISLIKTVKPVAFYKCSAYKYEGFELLRELPEFVAVGQKLSKCKFTEEKWLQMIENNSTHDLIQLEDVS